jgi:hypothetical protein
MLDVIIPYIFSSSIISFLSPTHVHGHEKTHKHVSFHVNVIHIKILPLPNITISFLSLHGHKKDILILIC